MHRVRVIHWKPDEVRGSLEQLREAGYQVEFDPLTNDILRAIKSEPPDAVVIDLSRMPSQGRDMAIYLRKYKATRRVPILFVEGLPEKVERVQQSLPDAIYTTWSEIGKALEDAISNPPEQPLVPDSLFSGYSGTPLPKKLGVKPDSILALLDAPQGFEGTLGELPDKVAVQRHLEQRPDVTLWFLTEKEELDFGIERVGAIAGDGRLWIVWPKKSSGVKSDISQVVVRKVGLDSGLVDFKIAAIDETWSGLCFTKRKQK